MVVQPAEVGLAVHGRIGEHRPGRVDRSGPGERVRARQDVGGQRVGLEQAGHPGRRAHRVARDRQVVQCGQRLRSARDHRQVAHLHRVRGRSRARRPGGGGIRSESGIDAVDLDRRVGRPQSRVRDHDGSGGVGVRGPAGVGVAGGGVVVVVRFFFGVFSRAFTLGDAGAADRWAELGDRHQTRRALERLVDQDGAGAGAVGEVVAHHQVPDAQRGERGGHALRGAAVGEAALDGIQRADRGRRLERHRIAHGPGGLGEGLERFVAGDAPDLAAEGGAGHDQGAGGGGGVVVGVGVGIGIGVGPGCGGLGPRSCGRRVLRQPRRRLGPEVRQLLVGTDRGELAQPRRGHGDARGEHHDHRDRHGPVPLRVRQRARHLPAVAAHPGQQVREQMRHAEHDR